MTDDQKAQAVLDALALRKWRFQDPSGTYTLTDRQILEYYWRWWSAQMYRQLRQDEATEENCIADFVVSHWAWQVYD